MDTAAGDFDGRWFYVSVRHADNTPVAIWQGRNRDDMPAKYRTACDLLDAAAPAIEKGLGFTKLEGVGMRQNLHSMFYVLEAGAVEHGSE